MVLAAVAGQGRTAWPVTAFLILSLRAAAGVGGAWLAAGQGGPAVAQPQRPAVDYAGLGLLVLGLLIAVVTIVGHLELQPQLQAGVDRVAAGRMRSSTRDLGHAAARHNAPPRPADVPPG